VVSGESYSSNYARQRRCDPISRPAPIRRPRGMERARTRPISAVVVQPRLACSLPSRLRRGRSQTSNFRTPATCVDRPDTRATSIPRPSPPACQSAPDSLGVHSFALPSDVFYLKPSINPVLIIAQWLLAGCPSLRWLQAASIASRDDASLVSALRAGVRKAIFG
jgi:hypothetical protein